MFSCSILHHSHQASCSASERPISALQQHKCSKCSFHFHIQPLNGKVQAPSHPASYWALPMMPEALCLPISDWFLPSTRSSTPPPTSPGGEWLGGLVWADTHCSLVARPESWEAGSLHIPLPNTKTFQRQNNTASLVFHQRTLQSWGGSIGNSEDIEVQPCAAHHEHKISHVFSVGILCLPHNICLFFPEVVVPLNLFLNLKKKIFWNIKIPSTVPKSFYPDLLESRLPGLLWWLSGKESHCQCRRHRFDPWPGKIPHAAEQLCLCTTTAESMCPRAHALQEASTPQLELQPVHCN